jgi:hypothetical protein
MCGRHSAYVPSARASEGRLITGDQDASAVRRLVSDNRGELSANAAEPGRDPRLSGRGGRTNRNWRLAATVRPVPARLMRRGPAWNGMAWRGTAWRDMVRFGSAGETGAFGHPVSRGARANSDSKCVEFGEHYDPSCAPRIVKLAIPTGRNPYAPPPRDAEQALLFRWTACGGAPRRVRSVRRSAGQSWRAPARLPSWRTSASRLYRTRAVALRTN